MRADQASNLFDLFLVSYNDDGHNGIPCSVPAKIVDRHTIGPGYTLRDRGIGPVARKKETG